MWLSTNTDTDSARFVFSVSVGGRNPGISPSRFENRMNMNSVPTSGR